MKRLVKEYIYASMTCRCKGMEGTGDHYAKCNKPVSEDKHYMMSPISGT